MTNQDGDLQGTVILIKKATNIPNNNQFIV